MQLKHNTDRIAALFMLFISAVFWWQLTKISEELDKIFPRFILICMMTLSLLLLVKSFINPDLRELFVVKKRKNVIIGVTASVFWVTFLNFLGFGLTSTITFTFLSWLLVERKDRKPSLLRNSIITAVILTMVIYFVFSTFLEVPLPKGIWA